MLQILTEYVQMHMGSIGGAIVLIILSCIEISKIKLNPISAFLKFVGKACNATLYEKMDALEKQQNELSAKFEQTYEAMQERFIDIDTQIDSKFNDLNEKINNVDNNLDFSVAMTSRYRIIRAADEIVAGSDISKDRLDVLLNDDLAVYQSYCNRHPKYINHKGQNSKRLLLDYEKEIQKRERQNNKTLNS